MRCGSRLLCPSRGLASGVIAALRADREFAVAVRTRVHFHLTVAALVFRRRRFVSNGVLAANIVGHGTADGVNCIQRFGEESEAARSLGHDLQGTSGVLRVLFLLQDANGVNRWSAVALQTPYRLLQSFCALVVVSVRNYKNDFLFALRFFFQVVRGSYDGIVERRAAASLDLFQPRFQLVDVGSEILVKVVLVVEVDDEHLIIGIRRAHQIQGGCVHLLALLAHGTRAIDHDAHGDGDLFLAERRDGLEMPVLVDVEVALIEAGDDALLVVDDRGVQHDFFDIFAENEDAAVGGIRILPLIRSDDLPRGDWRRRAAGRSRWGIRRRLGTSNRSRRRLVRGSALRLRVRAGFINRFWVGHGFSWAVQGLAKYGL